jgi:hypothetical protein
MLSYWLKFQYAVFSESTHGMEMLLECSSYVSKKNSVEKTLEIRHKNKLEPVIAHAEQTIFL